MGSYQIVSKKILVLKINFVNLNITNDLGTLLIDTFPLYFM